MKKTMKNMKPPMKKVMQKKMEGVADDAPKTPAASKAATAARDKRLENTPL